MELFSAETTGGKQDITDEAGVHARRVLTGLTGHFADGVHVGKTGKS